ncbi:hypothetical protein ACI78Q_15550 [Geodermatophilus sp. SYSU D00705]
MTLTTRIVIVVIGGIATIEGPLLGRSSSTSSRTAWPTWAAGTSSSWAVPPSW